MRKHMAHTSHNNKTCKLSTTNTPTDKHTHTQTYYVKWWYLYYTYAYMHSSCIHVDVTHCKNRMRIATYAHTKNKIYYYVYARKIILRVSRPTRRRSQPSNYYYSSTDTNLTNFFREESFLYVCHKFML